VADQKQAVPQYIPPPAGKAYAEMTGSEKMTFLGKVMVMLITGGFAFPNVFVE
jgi:hypothetical protein